MRQDIKVGYWASGASAAIGLVLEEGKFLEAEGLKPTWTTVTKLAEVNRALISRSIDIAVVGGTLPSLRLGAENVPAKIMLANLIADANFVVPENSPIKTLADLKGKKIGSTPPGSTMHALVSAILQGNYGLSESDFQQIPSGEAQLLTFLQRGEIDAALMRTITLRTFGGQAKLRNLGTVPDEWKKLIKADSPPLLGVGVVDNAFANSKPDARGEAHRRQHQGDAVGRQEPGQGRRYPQAPATDERTRRQGVRRNLEQQLHRLVRRGRYDVAVAHGGNLQSCRQFPWDCHA